MTHCLGYPVGLANLERFAAKLREEFLFEVILGINFSHQPTTGLAATKHRHPEKAGTIIRAFSKFHGNRWFCL